jgi:hypothetical protein
MPARSKTKPTDSSANIGFEAKLWFAADSSMGAETAEGNLRNDMDAAEYKHFALDLILLQYCIYAPASGSVDLFVQSEKLVGSYGRQMDNITSNGQGRNATTRWLAKSLVALDAKIQLRRKCHCLQDIFHTILHELMTAKTRVHKLGIFA